MKRIFFRRSWCEVNVRVTGLSGPPGETWRGMMVGSFRDCVQYCRQVLDPHGYAWQIVKHIVIAEAPGRLHSDNLRQTFRAQQLRELGQLFDEMADDETSG